MQPRVSVLMPTYGHEHFIRRAIDSLLVQTMAEWELIIVDDASPDRTEEVVQACLDDNRISYHKLETNVGTGAALNYALDRARAPLVAYLPSDDVYYSDHLASLVALLGSHPGAFLAYSGVRHHYNRYAEGQIEGIDLQPVQVVHRITRDRWIERAEFVTDSMESMYWGKLRDHGDFLGTGRVTCEWVDHPDQLHRIIQEPVGGINTYRDRFQVSHPLRFRTTVGNRIDEVEHYRRFRERPDTPIAPEGLKILLVGELAYNPERVLALEEQGHKLYGLWMPRPYWYNTVGPLPFGHVEDIPRENWREEVKRIRPDVIYALLNWQAVPFAHEVMSRNPGVPFVWHFKEGPFISLEKGHWTLLVDLYLHADGIIYSSPEMGEWFKTVLPTLGDHPNRFILDGDLPKRDWFDVPFSPRLSEKDGEVHTVVPGRPIGLHPYTVQELAQNGVHLHFYGNFTHGQWLEWIEKTRRMAPNHLHLHANVGQEDWVREFSRYDAGWLHFFESANQGEIRRANWDDLNYPARMSTLMAAGIPMLQRDNAGSVVATQTLARELGTGLFFNDMAGLAQQLREKQLMEKVRANVLHHRNRFTFDYHAADLVYFFRRVIASKV